MNKLFQTVADNLLYVLSFLAIIVALFVLALLLEKAAQKKNGRNEPIFNTRKTAMIGMFSAIAAILMLFEFPLPFAPFFYKLDFSELPILIGTFAFGPAAGVMMEFIKILLKLIFKGTTTAFVGDLANFVVGCSFILPASVVYAFHKNKKSAVIADLWNGTQRNLSAARILQALRNTLGGTDRNGGRDERTGGGGQYCQLCYRLCCTAEPYQGCQRVGDHAACVQAAQPPDQDRA